MTVAATPPPWHAQLRALQWWLLAYLVMWLAFWVGIGRGAKEDTLGLLVMLVLVPYVGSIVYAYQVQRELNRAGLYKPGAWQVIAGAIILNPVVVGWFIPLSVIWVARRRAKAHAA